MVNPVNNCCEDSLVGELVCFSLLDSISDLYEKNHEYLSQRSSGGNHCFTSSEAYQEIWQDSNNISTVRFTLLVNIDDAQMIKSSRTCTTPVSFTVAELPMHRRIAKENVYNLGIFHGPKPMPSDLIWQKVPVEPLILLGLLKDASDDDDLYTNNTAEIETKLGKILAEIRIGAIIMDSVAKYKNLNHKAFNGFFGCPYCLARGGIIVTNSCRKCIYEFNANERSDLKTSEMYRRYSSRAQRTNTVQFGIKGPTILSKIVKLPQQLPIDYMHCILEGVCRWLLETHPFCTQRIRQQMDELVSSVKLPHDLSRKFRKFSEISYWKAHELRTLLLYLYPVFLEIVDEQSFMLLLMLSTVTRALCADYLTESEIGDIEKIIESFLTACQEIYEINAMRFNLHLLTHLTSQYKYMGNLIDTSAFTFENNIYNLKRSFHGTRGHLNQMAKNYVLEKGMDSVDYDVDRWLNMNDPGNLLNLRKSISIIIPDKIIGNFVDWTQPDPNLLTRLNRRHLNQEISAIKVIFRYKLNHVIYHSENYGYKRKSISYFVFYRNGSEECAGKIVYFMAICSDDSCQIIDTIYAVIENFHLFSNQYIVPKLPRNAQKSLKSIANLDIIRKNCQRAKYSRQIDLILAKNIICKAISIPDNSKSNNFWLSKCNFSLDHD